MIMPCGLWAFTGPESLSCKLNLEFLVSYIANKKGSAGCPQPGAPCFNACANWGCC